MPSYTKEQIDQAFRDYCDKKSHLTIAQAIGCAETTVIDWAKEYNWKPRREEIWKKAEEKTRDKLVDWKVKSLTVIDKTKDIYSEQLGTGKTHVAPGQMAAMLKVEQGLMGEAEKVEVTHIEQRGRWFKPSKNLDLKIKEEE